MAIGQSVSQSSALLRETWRMRVRKERGVIRYHWWLIPRLLQTKSDSMLDGGDGRERETSINDKGASHHGNRHTTKSHGTTQREEGDRGRRRRGQTKGGGVY